MSKEGGILQSHNQTSNSNTLMHYGVLGMKWGRRRTPEQLASAQTAKGEKKQSKIVKKQDKLRADIETQKKTVQEGNVEKRAIRSEKLSSTVQKNEIDRKIATNDFYTTLGKRRAQDKSFKLNARIKKLEDQDLRNDTRIAKALSKIDVNNQKISQLDQKYIQIGKKYLGK